MKSSPETPKRPRGRPRKPRPLVSPPPKPMGRPPLGDAAKRITITVRVTPAEYDLWRKQAQEADMPLTAYIVEPLRRLTKRKGKA